MKAIGAIAAAAVCLAAWGLLAAAGFAALRAACRFAERVIGVGPKRPSRDTASRVIHEDDHGWLADMSRPTDDEVAWLWREVNRSLGRLEAT